MYVGLVLFRYSNWQIILRINFKARQQVKEAVLKWNA